jgi:hypothetical protein
MKVCLVKLQHKAAKINAQNNSFRWQKLGQAAGAVSADEKLCGHHCLRVDIERLHRTIWREVQCVASAELPRFSLPSPLRSQVPVSRGLSTQRHFALQTPQH